MKSYIRPQTATQERAGNCANPKFDEIMQNCIEHQTAIVIEQLLCLKHFCESPIEEIFLAAFYSQSLHRDFFDIVMLGKPIGDMSKGKFQGETIYILQQAKVGRYRVDFLIIDASCPLEIADPRFMIVECDGHEFHEKTKEQVERDKKRDRYFQSKNFKVLRFSGSEIWKDAFGCVEEVIANLRTNDGCEDGLI